VTVASTAAALNAALALANRAAALATRDDSSTAHAHQLACLFLRHQKHGAAEGARHRQKHGGNAVISGAAASAASKRQK